MGERWVLNASPIIVLARVGRAFLFDALADEIVVPRAVIEEIEAGPAGNRARAAESCGRFAVVSAPRLPEVLSWDLGRSETTVLSHAPEYAGRTVILDDAAARKCARSFGNSLKGTLAVVILAKQRGLNISAAEVLLALLEGGFRMDEGIVHDALFRTVGEEWDQPAKRRSVLERPRLRPGPAGRVSLSPALDPSKQWRSLHDKRRSSQRLSLFPQGKVIGALRGPRGRRRTLPFSMGSRRNTAAPTIGRATLDDGRGAPEGQEARSPDRRGLSTSRGRSAWGIFGPSRTLV